MNGAYQQAYIEGSNALDTQINFSEQSLIIDFDDARLSYESERCANDDSCTNNNLCAKKNAYSTAPTANRFDLGSMAGINTGKAKNHEVAFAIVSGALLSLFVILL